jgi:hypothetical protein
VGAEPQLQPTGVGPVTGPLAPIRVVAVRPDRAEERATAEHVLAGPLVDRRDLAAGRGAGATHSGEFWQSDGWFVKSRTQRRFTELEPATAALDRLFAVKRALGELSPARSILAVGATAAGVYQVWTIAPQLVSLRERLDATAAAARWDDFAGALAGYDLALGESLSSSIDTGICLDPSPTHFATQGGRVRYIGDDVAINRDALGLEEAFVARFAEYPGAPTTVWDAYVWRFVRELALRLSPRDRSRLQLAERLRSAARVRCAGRPYVDRVLAALEAL